MRGKRSGLAAALMLFALPAVHAATPPRVLYLNFDGATLFGRPDCSDAALSCSLIIQGGSGMATVPPFAGTPAARDLIVDAAKRFYAPFNVRIVTSRPTEGPYSMCMIGGRPSDVGIQGGGAAGVAPLDCSDEGSANDISFIFSDVIRNDVLAVAITIAQESAHAYGLSHVSDPTDIMFPALSGFEKTFQDKSEPICNLDAQFNCKPASGCDGTGMQNSFRAMIAVVGAAADGPARDAVPPTIRVVAPTDGAHVQPGFSLDFDAHDDVAVRKVELYVDNLLVGGAGQTPFRIDVPNGFLADGAHAVRAMAYDAENNHTGSNEIHLTVDGGVGKKCSVDGDCPGGLCVTDPTAGRICSRPCQNVGDCPLNYICGAPPAAMVCTLPFVPGSSSGCALASPRARPPRLRSF